MRNYRLTLFDAALAANDLPTAKQMLTGICVTPAPGAYNTMVYDNAGNNLVKWEQGSQPMSFSYDNANRITTMLQGAALTTYQYDNTGNLTQENLNGALTTNIFDNENRLTFIQFPTGGVSSYTYAGDGLRRTAFEAGAVLTMTIWDGDDYLMEIN